MNFEHQLLSFHLFETMAATFDVQMEMQTTKERPPTISRTSIVYSDESPLPTQPPHTPIIPMLSMAAEADIGSPTHSHGASSIDSVPLNLSVDHQSTSSVLHQAEDSLSGEIGKLKNRFEWHSVNVFVGNGSSSKMETKQIIHDSHGTVHSGELLAVMGGSGAGKSTLLDALSGRSNLHQLHIEGDLAINGRKLSVRKQRLMQSLCAFVPQSDILCPTQTVEEALWFYARLKLHHQSRAEQEARIEYLIDVLHLSDCRHSRIGDERKVLSVYKVFSLYPLSGFEPLCVRCISISENVDFKALNQ